jgi:regulator of protease activity HflC (stomatin/prohibitin superfamily)
MHLPIFLIVFIVFIIVNVIKIVTEYERAIVFRFGRALPEPKGPGLIFVMPLGIDRVVKVDLRTKVLDVPPQDIITKDNVSVKVNAVVYFRVVDPVRAILEVENFHFATSQMAQTTLRSILGQGDLDELLTERDKVNHELQAIIDKATDPWGIKVSSVEVKHVDLPTEMQRAMARQAEAERERRAKIIAAEGEQQAAAKLVEAAQQMADHPMAMQMRYLQTLVEISGENNSTTIFPVPIDIFSAFANPRK